jgi:hypothetical protein
MLYNGLIIKESLKDKSVLKRLNISRKETWAPQIPPDTERNNLEILFFENNDDKINSIIDELRKALSEKWYISVSNENYTYLIFTNKIYCYRKNDKIKQKIAENYIIRQGLPENKMIWQEKIKSFIN